MSTTPAVFVVREHIEGSYQYWLLGVTDCQTNAERLIQSYANEQGWGEIKFEWDSTAGYVRGYSLRKVTSGADGSKSVCFLVQRVEISDSGDSDFRLPTFVAVSSDLDGI